MPLKKKLNKFINLGADGSHPLMANAKTSQMDEPHPDYNKDFINNVMNAADGTLNKVSSKKEPGYETYAAGGAAVGAGLGATMGLNKLIRSWKEGKQFNEHYGHNTKLIPMYTLIGALSGANVGAGAKYLKKEAAEEEKKKGLPGLAIAGIAGAVGIGSALAFRRGFNKTPAQIASKGKLTWTVPPEVLKRETTHPKTIAEKIKKQISYDDIQFLNVSRKNKVPKRVEGALYNEAELDARHIIPKADISYNVNPKIVESLQNKENYGKMKGKMVPQATGLTSVLKKKNYTPNGILTELAGTKEKVYYKPREGEASAGEWHFDTDQFKRMQGDPKYYVKRKTELNYLTKHPDEYIAQKHIDVEKIKSGPDIGHPVSERRVHFAVHDNKVSIMGPKLPRWFESKDIQLSTNKSLITGTGAIAGAATGMVTSDTDNPKKTLRRGLIGAAIGGGATFGAAKILEHGVSVPTFYMRPDKKELEKGIQEIWSKNPRLKSKTPSILGADVLTDKAGKKHIIEINDQSGYLHPDAPTTFLATQSMYKHITGKDTKVMAAAKGTLVGGATAAGLGIVNKKLKGSD
jgi:hypothetical protein